MAKALRLTAASEQFNVQYQIPYELQVNYEDDSVPDSHQIKHKDLDGNVVTSDLTDSIIRINGNVLFINSTILEVAA